jgi:hypothetical protein
MQGQLPEGLPEHLLFLFWKVNAVWLAQCDYVVASYLPNAF